MHLEWDLTNYCEITLNLHSPKRNLTFVISLYFLKRWQCQVSLLHSRFSCRSLEHKPSSVKTRLLILLGVGRTRTSPYTLLCDLSTFDRLPSTCFLLHKPELTSKFANKILDCYWGRKKKSQIMLCSLQDDPIHALPAFFLVQLSFLLPAAFGTIVGIDCAGGGRIFQLT